MRIAIKKPGQPIEIKEVENELRALQEIAGGYIQCVNIFDNVLCVCNEEGKLKDLPANFVLGNDVIVGNVFFCAAGDEDFESLNDEQIEILMNEMHIFEIKN